MLTRPCERSGGGALYAIDASAPNSFARDPARVLGEDVGALAPDKSERVDLAAVLQNFKMHMGPRGATG